jgi:Fibronectin type III domain
VPPISWVQPTGLGALVAWAPNPASDAVTGYVVTATVDGTSSTCAPVTTAAGGGDSEALVQGLCAKVPYILTVAATNSAGTSAPSAPSNPVVPLVAQPPAIPLITSVTGRSGSLVVDFEQPSDDGGAALKDFAVSATPAAGGTPVTVTVPAPANPTTSPKPVTLTGLTNGTSYNIVLTATNKIGISPEATATGTPEAAYAPAAPQGLTAVGSNGKIAVTWSAPGDDGGDSVTGYSVTYQEVTQTGVQVWTATPGISPVTVTTKKTSLNVTGLTPTTGSWTFAVSAITTAGTGTAATTPEPVSPVVKIRSGVVVLPPASLATLTSIDNGVFTWTGTIPTQVAALTVGQTMVGGEDAPVAPGGFADKIDSITPITGGLQITAHPVGLSDVVSEGSIAADVSPSSTTNGSFHATVAGVRSLATPDSTIGFSHTFSLQGNLGTAVSFHASLTPSVTLTAHAGFQAQIPPAYLNLVASAKVTATAEVTATQSIDETIPIGDIGNEDDVCEDPIDFQLGPVPVVVCPQIDIDLDVDGDAAATAQATLTVGEQVGWSSNQPYHFVNPVNLSGTPTFTAAATAGISATASLSATLSEEPELLIYDTFGPDFDVTETLAADFNAFPSPGTPYLQVTFSVSLSAGLTIDLEDLDISENLNATLYTLSFPVYQVDAPPYPVITITPANSAVNPGTGLQFAGSINGTPDTHVTWGLTGQATGDKITTGGLFTPVAPTGRFVTVTAKDSSNGGQGQTTVEVGVPFDAPGSLEATPNLAGTQLAVSWTAPASTGGNPLSSYVLTTQPATGTTTVSGTSTSATLSNLTPGTTYVVTLAATNSAGLQSPPVTTTANTTPQCTITWIGGDTASPAAWGDPNNWSPARVPSLSDLACIGGSTEVAASTTVGGIEDNGDITVDAGKTLTVTEAAILNGDLEGPGTLTAEPEAQLTLLGDATLEGGATLVNYGQATAPVAGGGLSVSGASLFQNDGELALADGSTLGGGADNGGNIINESDGTIIYSGGPDGALIVSSGFDNDGVVDVEDGTLYVFSPNTSTGVDTGTYNVGAGGTLLLGDGNLGGGNRTLGPTASVIGAGSLEAGNLSVDQATILVTISLIGSLTITGPTNFSDPVDDGGNITISSGSTASFSNLTMGNGDGGTIGPRGILSGPGTALIPSNGSLTLYPNSELANGVVLVNEGTASVPTTPPCLNEDPNYQQAYCGVLFTGSSDLDNDGQLTLGDNTSLGNENLDYYSSNDMFYTDGSVVNGSSGTISYAGGPIGAAILLGMESVDGFDIDGTGFDNEGTVEVANGTFDIESQNIANGSDAGSYILSGGADLEFSGGRTLTSTAAVLGSGSLSSVLTTVNGSNIGVPCQCSNLYLGASTSFAHPVTTSDLNVPASLTGSFNSLTLSSNASLNGPGSVVINEGGNLSVGTNAMLAGGVELINQGTTVTPSGSECTDPFVSSPCSIVFESSSSLVNEGDLVVSDGSSLGSENVDNNLGPGYSGSFINESGGTVSYVGGSYGAEIYLLEVDNYGSMVIGDGNLTIGGANWINAGSWSVHSGGMLTLDGFGSLTSTGSLSGQGTLDVEGDAYGEPDAYVTDDAASVSIGSLILSGSLDVDAGNTVIAGTFVGGGNLGIVLEKRMPPPLKVTGQAQFAAGALTATAAPGYDPKAGTKLILLTFGSETGAFSSISVPSTPGYTVTVGKTKVAATAL